MAARPTKKATKTGTSTVRAAAKKTTGRAVKKASKKKNTTKITRKITSKTGPTPAEGPVEADWAQQLAETVQQVQQSFATELATVRDTMAEALAEARQPTPPADWTPAPSEPPIGADGDLEQVTRAFRRTLAEVLDDRAEALATPLATVHSRLEGLATQVGEAGEPLRAGLQQALAELNAVLERLGVARFQPTVGEEFDPLIHSAVGEQAAGDLADGQIARVVAAGYCSGRGRILVQSRVVVQAGPGAGK